MSAARWTRETGVAELQGLADETLALAEQRRFSEGHTRWIMRVHRVLEDIFGRNSRYYEGFNSLTWEMRAGVPFIGLPDPATAVEREHQKAYLQQLETARGLLLDAKDQLDATGPDAVYEGKDTPPESSALVRVINLAEHAFEEGHSRTTFSRKNCPRRV